jgi:hypothetical protein
MDFEEDSAMLAAEPSSCLQLISDRFSRCFGFGGVGCKEDGAIALDKQCIVGNIKHFIYYAIVFEST